MAQARLTVTNREHTGRLVVSVDGPDSLVIGESHNYVASIADSESDPVDLNLEDIKWRVVPSKLGVVTWEGINATLAPSQAGRGVIIVDGETPQGKGTGRVSITVEKQ